jgi:hypothetical protein
VAVGLTEKKWRRYEEDVAAFYRTLGLEAETQVKLQGARAVHEVDVVVRFEVHGVAVMWVVECKDWTRAVPKERVLALDAIVKDVGADRGILVAESGFQAGAIQFAQQNNLTLTSLEVLEESSTAERFAATAGSYQERIIQIALAVKRLWMWTKPRSDDSALAYKDVIEVAAASFELQNLLLPKMSTIGGPFDLTYRQAHAHIETEVQLTEFLEPRVHGIEVEIAAADDKIETAKTRTIASAERLREAIELLIRRGKLLANDPRDEAASAFVVAMKQVSAEAESVTRGAPAEVSRAVRTLMRFLIDTTYLSVREPNPDWGSQAARLDLLLEGIFEQLNRA